MTEYETVERFMQLQNDAEDLGLRVSTGAYSFIIQNKALCVLSDHKTLDGVSGYLKAVSYASRKDFKGFN